LHGYRAQYTFIRNDLVPPEDDKGDIRSKVR